MIYNAHNKRLEGPYKRLSGYVDHDDRYKVVTSGLNVWANWLDLPAKNMFDVCVLYTMDNKQIHALHVSHKIYIYPHSIKKHRTVIRYLAEYDDGTTYNYLVLPIVFDDFIRNYVRE